MKVYKSHQSIGQLEKRQGGYYFLKIEADVVDSFKNGKQTRFICTVDKKLIFSCGLNHLGDENYFIILSTKKVKELGRSIEDTVAFELREFCVMLLPTCWCR